MYSLAILHDNCLAVLYILILTRPHTSKAVLLHCVTPVLALHRLHASFPGVAVLAVLAVLASVV